MPQASSSVQSPPRTRKQVRQIVPFDLAHYELTYCTANDADAEADTDMSNGNGIVAEEAKSEPEIGEKA